MRDSDEESGTVAEPAESGHEFAGGVAEAETDLAVAEEPDAESTEAPAEVESQLGPMGPGQANLTDAIDDDGSADGPLREGPGLAGAVALAPEHLMGALEALILVSDKPIAAVRLARLTRQDVGVVRMRLAELAEAYAGRGIVLDEIAGGFQFRTSSRFAPFVRHLVQQKPTKLTRAQLEVLAIIAYRQPVTRPEMEDVRGVDSGSALRVLLERNVIKIIGKKDEAGRPMLYATTSEFLELFGLRTLRDLPTLREFAELSAESRDMFERRIGEPVAGTGMNLETHYVPEAGASPGEALGHEPVDDDHGVKAPTDTHAGRHGAEFGESARDPAASVPPPAGRAPGA